MALEQSSFGIIYKMVPLNQDCHNRYCTCRGNSPVTSTSCPSNIEAPLPLLSFPLDGCMITAFTAITDRQNILITAGAMVLSYGTIIIRISENLSDCWIFRGYRKESNRIRPGSSPDQRFTISPLNCQATVNR